MTGLLNSTVTYAVKSTSNVKGGQIASYTPGPSFCALIVDSSPNLQLVYAQRHIFLKKTIYVQCMDIEPQVGDIILWRNKRFFIEGVLDPTGLSQIFEIHCSECVPGTIIVEQRG